MLIKPHKHLIQIISYPLHGGAETWDQRNNLCLGWVLSVSVKSAYRVTSLWKIPFYRHLLETCGFWWVKSLKMPWALNLLQKCSLWVSCRCFPSFPLQLFSCRDWDPRDCDPPWLFLLSPVLDYRMKHSGSSLGSFGCLSFFGKLSRERKEENKSVFWLYYLFHF